MPGETTTLHESNDKCPECKQPMKWTEGLLNNGARVPTVGRYSCIGCGIFFKQKDSRETREGKVLAYNYIGERNKVSKIGRHSVGRQIGIYRALQHCRTCGNAAGKPCTCGGKCNCPHCLDRGNYKG